MEQPKLTEFELNRAQELGREAGAAGKPETANPYFLTTLRARWLGGWDAGRSEAAWAEQ